MSKGKLGQIQKEAWGTMLVAYARLTKALDAKFVAEGLPALEVYDVLLALEDAPDRRLTMSELAEAVVFSRSGLTRLVDRLQMQGYVHREMHPRDRRSTYAVLTTAGLELRERAWPRYSELIQEHFGQYVSDEEAQAMRDTLKRVIAEHFYSDQATRELSITGGLKVKK